MKVRELMAILIQMSMDDEIEFRPVVRPARLSDVVNEPVQVTPPVAPPVDPETQRLIDRAIGPKSEFDDIFTPL